MTDPIADMITRIRNALGARHNSVDVPMSKTKIEIAKVLKEEGYISDYKALKEEIKKIIRIELKYTPEGEAIINEIRRISKPGRRVYINKNEIPRIKGGVGTSILSTSKGIMAGTEARRFGIGGELICTIW